MHNTLRPSVRLLDDSFVHGLIDEALEVVARVGVYIENREACVLLQEGGVRLQAKSGRAFFPRHIVEHALQSVPQEIVMYDLMGERSYVVGADHVHFDPGSAALKVFDHQTQSERGARTGDLVQFARLVDRLDNFHFQSTGIVASDVPELMADSYRLYVMLQYCAKPIVTGTFVVEGFKPMRDMLAVVRGGSEALRMKPLAIFDACPSPPLKWSNLTAQSVIDCARAGVPSELVAMPLAGATAPATLSGALVQHTAENLAGIVLAQLAAPGAPVIFGGSPAIFDMRAGTPPMGAIESMMLIVGYTQIGKALHLPTHGYMGLSDAKCVDAQAGLESGIGTVLAALAGTNVVSGGGMIDYENCQSPEKLVIDNEICGMAYRLLSGIAQRNDPMAIDLLKDLAEGGDFLTHPHTLEWFQREQFIAAIVDRENYQHWVAAGKLPLSEKASFEASRILSAQTAQYLRPDVVGELRSIILSYGRNAGIYELPPLPENLGQ